MKQLEMDTALEPFSPKSLYLRLLAALAEQARLCDGLEASFFSFDHPPHHRHRPAGDVVRTREEQAQAQEQRQEEEEEEDEELAGLAVEREDDGAGAGGAGTAAARGIKRESHQLIDFISSYRRARQLYHLRREQKNRWDEGRVGGWR